MAHESFAATVLKKALDLAAAQGGRASCGDISSALFIQTRQQHKRLLNTLSELSRAGKLQRIEQGLYAAPDASSRQAIKPDKREKMWLLLKIRRKVSLDDMVELAGVSRRYAWEWLAMLVKHEIVKKIEQPGAKDMWLLLPHDAIDMPVLDDQAARLRLLRRKKKSEISAKLDIIDTALADVRQVLSTMEDEQ